MTEPRTGDLYMHKHSKHLFIIVRVRWGWVYTKNITLGKDKSVHPSPFAQFFTLLHT